MGKSIFDIAELNTSRLWARILKHSKPSNKTSDILWTGTKNQSGYGLMSQNKKPFLVHRVVYELVTGEKLSPKDLVIHSCDVPNCINPKHLRKAAPLDNSTDMVNRKRHRYGSNHPQAKLTEDEVLEIRKLWLKQNVRVGELAKRFHVTSGTISQIVQGIIWRHLDNKRFYLSRREENFNEFKELW